MIKFNRNLVIGMIHAQALPGTPRNQYKINDIIRLACKDAELYKKCNVGGVLLENMHDLPYMQSNQLGPEVTSSMTVICSAVRSILPPNIVCGVQVLAGGNKQALATALAAGLDFIRAEAYVYSHVADEGLMNACAGDLLRYRKNIDGSHIQIFTDIKKKHCAHAITSDIKIEEEAKAAEFFLSDGLIVTGAATGDPACPQDIVDVKKNTTLPVIVGSGVTEKNVHQYAEASGFIVGSHFKKDGFQVETSVALAQVTKVVASFVRSSSGPVALSQGRSLHSKLHPGGGGLLLPVGRAWIQGGKTQCVKQEFLDSWRKLKLSENKEKELGPPLQNFLVAPMENILYQWEGIVIIIQEELTLLGIQTGIILLLVQKLSPMKTMKRIRLVEMKTKKVEMNMLLLFIQLEIGNHHKDIVTLILTN